MTALVWDAIGEHKYETGVDHGVLYLATSGVYDKGYAWNGLTTVTESPSGAEATPQYADNIKYLNLVSLEEFSGTIEAFTYPDEFAECDGTYTPFAGVAIGQQNRRPFGMCYRTLLGDDDSGNDAGHKLHLVYGATCSPSEKAYSTVNDSPAAINFSWEFWTVPVPVSGKKPTSLITIDSTKVDSTALTALETMLYGSVGIDPFLPLPAAVLAMFDGTVTKVTPGVPTYNSTTDIITIPSTTGAVYHMDGAVVPAGPTAAISANKIIYVTAADGYYLDPLVVDRWLITFV